MWNGYKILLNKLRIWYKLRFDKPLTIDEEHMLYLIKANVRAIHQTKEELRDLKKGFRGLWGGIYD